MEWTIVLGCVVGAWAMLSIVGNERQSRVEDMERRARAAAQRAADKESEVVELHEVKTH